MGNLLTFTATIFSPLITKEYLTPYFMHPYRWGGIPFQPPGPFQMAFLYLLFNLMIIGFFATISGLMTSAKECRKVHFWTAIVNAKWAMLFALVGIIVINVAPFIKAPVLAVVSWMPYAKLFVDGLYIGLFVLLGGMIGNGYNRKDVCHPNSKP